MKPSAIDILRKFVIRGCIQHLVETSEHPIWLNLTFGENVTKKDYASRCWDKLSKRLVRQYPSIRLVGIWARQRRGAWHIHAVCDRRLPVRWLRMNAVGCGFGVQCYLQELDGKTETPQKISRYIAGYCTDKNGLDPVIDKGVRRMIFVGSNVRALNMRYRSVLKKCTSVGREIANGLIEDERQEATEFMREFSRPGGWKKVWETWGEWYKRNRDYWFELGWSEMSVEEQADALVCDEYVRRYFETGRWSYV